MSLERQLSRTLIDQRGWDLRQPHGENVVLMLTGGLDSSLLTAMCLEVLQARVFPLYVRRGSRAQQYEEQAAWAVVKYLQDKYGDNMQDLYVIEAEIPPADIKSTLPTSYLNRIGHPMRNAMLQLYAVQRAVMLSQGGVPVHSVLAGSVNGDISPDTNLASYLATTLTTCIGLDDWQWQVMSPYLVDGLLPGKDGLYKGDLLVWAKAHDFPLQLTRSCMSASAKPCGGCTACVRRDKLFKRFEVDNENHPLRDDQ